MVNISFNPYGEREVIGISRIGRGHWRSSSASFILSDTWTIAFLAPLVISFNIYIYFFFFLYFFLLLVRRFYCIFPMYLGCAFKIFRLLIKNIYPSILFRGKIGASLHRSSKGQAIGGRPPYLRVKSIYEIF
jgi:hypothetical protein